MFDQPELGPDTRTVTNQEPLQAQKVFFLSTGVEIFGICRRQICSLAVFF